MLQNSSAKIPGRFASSGDSGNHRDPQARPANPPNLPADPPFVMA